MVLRVHDAYILNLDELPKCVEADGIVWPVWLRVNDAARLFHITPKTLQTWIKTYEIPFAKIGPQFYIEVQVLADFVHQNTYTYDEYRAFHRKRREEWLKTHPNEPYPSGLERDEPNIIDEAM